MRTAAPLILALLTFGTACTDTAGGGPLILITNSWFEVDGDLSFSLNATSEEPARSGTFEGNQDDGFNDPVPVEGEWRSGRIDMTVFSDPQITWRARVTRDEPDTLVFTRTVGAGTDSLVIFRN